MRRAKLRQILDRRGISYPVDAGKDKLVLLCESLDLDPMAPEHGLKWDTVPEFDEDGRQIGVQHYPNVERPASAQVNDSARFAKMEQNTSEEKPEEVNDSIIDTLRQENLRLQEDIFLLRDTITNRMARLEATQLAPKSMTPWQLTKVLRDNGVEVGKNVPKAELMRMLEAHLDGKNTAAGSERGSEES